MPRRQSVVWICVRPTSSAPNYISSSGKCRHLSHIPQLIHLHFGTSIVNLLPWLLNWPPRPASIIAFLFLTAFSVGSLVLFAPITDQINPDESTIEASNVSVQLNDEITMPDIENDTVATCIASGTPGDQLTVRADILVETPMEDGEDSTYDVEVIIGDNLQTTTEPIQQTGREQVDLLWTVRDDESLSVGSTADIRIRLRESGAIVDTATRTVTVKKATRSYDCES